MKKIFIVLAAFAASLSALASPAVTIRIADGIDDAAMKAKMERAMSTLFTEVGKACEANKNPNYAAMPITEGAKEDISMLWENSKFICWDQTVVQHCLTTGTGYQVRNIPLELVDADDDDKYHEAVLNFDRRGNLTSFHLSISTNLYMDVIKSNLELTDLRRRQLILDWTEQFRTAYNQKDLNFLNAVFSNDALIITGRVTERKTRDGMPLPPKVELIEKNKEQYMTALAEVFRKNKTIRVTFDEIEVLMHSVDADVYGVTLHQGYTSDTYHDDGYLFLLWDFRNEAQPQIHVRAWQPDSFIQNGKRVAAPHVDFTPDEFDI